MANQTALFFEVSNCTFAFQKNPSV